MSKVTPAGKYLMSKVTHPGKYLPIKLTPAGEYFVSKVVCACKYLQAETLKSVHQRKEKLLLWGTSVGLILARRT